MTKDESPAASVMQYPAYVVERKPLAWLKPSAKNARTHSKEQIGQIRGSLKKFGWTVPVLAREDGTIIAGHGRVEAGKLEGILEVPVIVAIDWTEEQCRAYALADNRIALNSGWDKAILGPELDDLSAAGTDLGLLGFSEKELTWLLSKAIDTENAESAPQLAGLSYSVVVRCKDEAHQSELLAQLEKQGLTCEALIS